MAQTDLISCCFLYLQTCSSSLLVSQHTRDGRSDGEHADADILPTAHVSSQEVAVEPVRVTESRVTWWRRRQACLFWFWEKVFTFLLLLSQRKLWPRVSVGVGRRDKGATEDVFACFRSRLHLAHVASQTVAERRRRQQQEALLFARCLHKQPSSYLWPQI